MVASLRAALQSGHKDASRAAPLRCLGCLLQGRDRSIHERAVDRAAQYRCRARHRAARLAQISAFRLDRLVLRLPLRAPALLGDEKDPIWQLRWPRLNHSELRQSSKRLTVARHRTFQPMSSGASPNLGALTSCSTTPASKDEYSVSWSTPKTTLTK